MSYPENTVGHGIDYSLAESRHPLIMQSLLTDWESAAIGRMGRKADQNLHR